jgi:hypothetical protein
MAVVRHLNAAVTCMVVLAWAAGPAHAQPGDDADEAAFRSKPTAQLAAAIARRWLDRGNRARAMNWAERAQRSPGLDAKTGAWVAKLRSDLRWRLFDDGIGQLQINVNPAHASVFVDGKELLPHYPSHMVWVKEGSHRVEATAKDHSEADQFVVAARGELRIVDLVLAMTRLPVLLLDAKPDCDVWIDNTYQGRCDKKRYTVQPGAHIVELRLDGYRSWVRELTFTLGEQQMFSVVLDKIVADVGPKRHVSVVDRPLTALELGQQGERHQVGERPSVASPLERAFGGNAVAPKDTGNQSLPDRSTRALPAVEVTSEGPAASAERPAVEVLAVAADVESGASRETPEAPAAAWSATTKGWLWTGTGLAMAGAGVGLAVLSVRQAQQAAEELPLGDADYRLRYDKAQQQAWIGYAAAGAGAVSAGVGSWYFFGRNGLSRSGKGWLLTGVGAAAAGVAGWLYWDARAQATSANELPQGDRDYGRRFDAAESQALVAYAAGGAGVALIGAGLFLALTDGGGASSARTEPSLPTSGASLAGWSLLPLVGPTRQGAVLQLAW